MKHLANGYGLGIYILFFPNVNRVQSHLSEVQTLLPLLGSAFGTAVFWQFTYLQPVQSLFSTEVLLFFEASKILVHSWSNVKDEGKAISSLSWVSENEFSLANHSELCKDKPQPLSNYMSDSLKWKYFLWNSYSSIHMCSSMHKHICPVLCLSVSRPCDSLQAFLCNSIVFLASRISYSRE